MKIPETLIIGGHEIKVLVPYKFRDRSDSTGQYDHGLKEIRLTDVDSCGNQSAESGILVAFLHEILHAIDYIAGHRIFVDQVGERAMEGIAEGLFQVLRDNELNFTEIADGAIGEVLDKDGASIVRVEK